MPEGDLLQESLNGFALVVSAEGIIFYASSTIVEYLGFHQTDVMHQNIYDYIHVDDRQEFCKQLHWAMRPLQCPPGQEPAGETGEEYVLNNLFNAQECDGTKGEYSPFLSRCFVCRVRCLLDSTSGFLTMQFQGKLKFLFGQKKKASLGAHVPPQLALFCVAAPLLIPALTELKMKNMLLRAKCKAGPTSALDAKSKQFPGLCDPELQERSGLPGFPEGLHSAETQIKLMNSGENGISLFKVRTSDDQWVWLEANTQHLYRNGCSEYVVVPPQAQSDGEDEESLKRPGMVLANKGVREPHIHSSPCETSLQHRQLNWTMAKHEKEDLKMKFDLNKSDGGFIQDEPLNFCKNFTNSQNHCTTNSTWSVLNPSSARPISQCTSPFPNRAVRPFNSGDQSDINAPTSCRAQRRSAEASQSYGVMQHLATEGYATENVKLERALMSPDTLYESGLPLDIPIKIENDSDSESSTDLYMAPPCNSWLGQGSMFTKPILSFPDTLHLKTESNHSDYFSGCQRSKHTPLFPHNGHGMPLTAQANGFNMCRPYKGTFHSQHAPLFPQKCGFLDSVISIPSPDCYGSQFYASGSSGERVQSDPVYKMQHSLIQTIKQEPLDSPPWPDSGQEMVHSSFPKHKLTSFLQNSALNKTPEYLFLQ